jgi:4-carboxymuconolactone decarboxylase
MAGASWASWPRWWALYRPRQLDSHLRLAMTNGLSRDGLVEALTHLAFYAGGPER